MMNEPSLPSAEERLFSEYPALSGFFEAMLWPGEEGSNVIELLHRVMRHWQPDYVTQLVIDLEEINRDRILSSTDLAEFLNRGVPGEWRLVDPGNCRRFVRALASYATYLYHEDGVRGTTP